MKIAHVGDVDLHLFNGEIGQIALLHADGLRGGHTRIGQRGKTGGSSRGRGSQEVPARDRILHHSLLFFVHRVSLGRLATL
jgi:hypothetical protein